MLLKTVKTLAWIVGGLAGLAVAIYVAALVVNWRDQRPSPDALKLAASYEARPSLAGSDNAFIYLLGLDAPLSDDPQEVGARRLAWLMSPSETRHDHSDDPQPVHLEYSSTDAVVQQFLDMCQGDRRDCAYAFADAGKVFEAWKTTHAWLLQRYLALIAHSAWREEVLDVYAPLPPFAHAIHGQRLLLLQAKVLADNGNTRAASELLGSDLRFWRTVLASSDLLITKMIATAALRQHFGWGSLVIRRFSSSAVATDIPDEWRRPMTEAELSLRRTLVGEWIFFATIPAREYAEFESRDGLAARLSERLMEPLFQQQATLNRHAAYLDELSDTLDAPLKGYASVADRGARLATRTADEAFASPSLYNLVGSFMLSSQADYAPYARRVADLEGIRRAALATVTLRDAETATTELAANGLSNPYDEEPLRWDAEDRAVVFVGLEPGERGEHRFYY